MTPTEFTSWQSRMGWSHVQTARAIYGVRNDAVRRFGNGCQTIPRHVELICLMIEAARDGAGSLAAARLEAAAKARIERAGRHCTKGGDRKSKKFREAA